jgi:cysteinyl-tRNA synthetase
MGDRCYFTEVFVRDMARLNIEPPTLFTPATEHIPEIDRDGA